MTSLLNPNDIEIKNKIINNINKCIENTEIYLFSKKKLITIINNYYETHIRLNIDKNNLLEYIILLIQDKIFDNLSNRYRQINLENNDSINIFNKYILSLININYENDTLTNLIENIVNKWMYNSNNKLDIDYIYYNIYNLKKSNDKIFNLINVSVNELDNNYNHMISINNSINELKDNNEINMNSIKEMKETNENNMNLINELKETNENNMNLINELKNNNEININLINEYKNYIIYLNNINILLIIILIFI